VAGAWSCPSDSGDILQCRLTKKRGRRFCDFQWGRRHLLVLGLLRRPWSMNLCLLTAECDRVGSGCGWPGVRTANMKTETTAESRQLDSNNQVGLGHQPIITCGGNQFVLLPERLYQIMNHPLIVNRRQSQVDFCKRSLKRSW
jgi:hypothetical protein